MRLGGAAAATDQWLWQAAELNSSAANVNPIAGVLCKTKLMMDSFTNTRPKLKGPTEPKHLCASVPRVIHMHSYT